MEGEQLMFTEDSQGTNSPAKSKLTAAALILASMLTLGAGGCNEYEPDEPDRSPEQSPTAPDLST
jgi:hypothetical protein